MANKAEGDADEAHLSRDDEEYDALPRPRPRPQCLLRHNAPYDDPRWNPGRIYSPIRLPGFPDHVVEAYMRANGYATEWEQMAKEAKEEKNQCPDGQIERESRSSNNFSTRGGAKLDAAHGVEGAFSASQSSITPPGQSQPTRRKRNRNYKHKTTQKNHSKALKLAGGSRHVLNKSAPTRTGCINPRTCLIDAVKHLLEPGPTRDALHIVMVDSMPAVGDTAIADILDALTSHGLELVPVGGNYHKTGGAYFHLMNERECSLVVNIKLTNTEGWPISHFVAWDGQVIHDLPKKSCVNNSSDRSEDGSRKVFEKLFNKKDFLSWQITKVYQLVKMDSRKGM